MSWWVIAVVLFVLWVYLPKPTPFRWHVEFQFLQGLLFTDWIVLLIKKKFSIDPVYWHRAIFVTFITLIDTYWVRREEKEYPKEKINKVPFLHAPVFIIGHYRTGTTMLHELLAMDDKTAWPSSFHCYKPHQMLAREANSYNVLGRFTFYRPMDKMEISVKSPNEDEFAMAIMTQMSPYMGGCFYRDVDYYDQYLSFENASQSDRQTWSNALQFFCRKLLYRNPDRTLVLKSPSHTARIEILKSIWPNAKFVHLCRNPYEVYASTKNLHEKLQAHWRLQRNDSDSSHWFVQHMVNMYTSYFKHREKLLQSGDLLEIKYEDLVQDPVKHLQRIYNQFNLPGFEETLPKWKKWVEEKHTSFQRNSLPNLSTQEKQTINKEWKFYFDTFKYNMMM